MKLFIVCSFIIACVQESLQCDCPIIYTQQIVCDSHIVLNATIHEREETADNVIYNMTINKVYKGADIIDNMSDTNILMTPQSSGRCGPIELRTNTTYIMTVNVYDDNIMRVIFCDYVAEASSIGNDALNGIESNFYLKNCDCQIPSMYNPDRRGKKWCRMSKLRGHRLCRLDTICYRNERGRCKWQRCSPRTANLYPFL